MSSSTTHPPSSPSLLPIVYSLDIFLSSLGYDWDLVFGGIGSIVSQYVLRVSSTQFFCPLPSPPMALLFLRVSISSIVSNSFGNISVGGILYNLCSRYIFPFFEGCPSGFGQLVLSS